MKWIRANFKEVAALMAVLTPLISGIWLQIMSGVEAKVELRLEKEYDKELDSLNYEIYDYQRDMADLLDDLLDCGD